MISILPTQKPFFLWLVFFGLTACGASEREKQIAQLQSEIEDIAEQQEELQAEHEGEMARLTEQIEELERENAQLRIELSRNNDGRFTLRRATPEERVRAILKATGEDVNRQLSDKYTECDILGRAADYKSSKLIEAQRFYPPGSGHVLAREAEARTAEERYKYCLEQIERLLRRKYGK